MDVLGLILAKIKNVLLLLMLVKSFYMIRIAIKTKYGYIKAVNVKTDE